MLLEADIMKYVLFIYQADDLDTKALSEAEYKEVAAQYAAVTATPNVTPGLPTILVIPIRVGDWPVRIEALVGEQRGAAE